MSLNVKRIVLVLSVLAVGTVAAEKQPFSRYQSIIDRMPFGQPPPGFNPEQMASEVSRSDAASAQELTQEQEAIQKAVAFSVINVDPDDGGVMVGFTDNADPKSPHHYYMRVGTTRDGWLVKEADIAEKTMTVVKDGVEVTLELGMNSSGGDSRSAKGAVASRPGSAGSSLSGAVPTRSGLLSRRAPGGGGVSTFQGRRRQREMEAAEAKADAEAREAERRKREQEAAEQAAADKAVREQERAEQREQLMAIQNELRRVREEKERARVEAEANGENGDGGADDES